MNVENGDTIKYPHPN